MRRIQTKHLKIASVREPRWVRGPVGGRVEAGSSLRNVGREWPLTRFRDSHMWLMVKSYSERNLVTQPLPPQEEEEEESRLV